MPGRMELTEDADLARRLLENDQGCLDDILRVFGAGILGLLRRRFRGVLREEDLEDVVSMGHFRLWTSRERYQLDRAFLRVWWYRLFENASRDVLRMGWQKARVREVNSEAAFVGISERSSPASCDSDRTVLTVPPPAAVHHDLKEVLSELPEVQRAILLADAAAVELSHRRAYRRRICADDHRPDILQPQALTAGRHVSFSFADRRVAVAAGNVCERQADGRRHGGTRSCL